jgi:hypothetical protein
MPLSSTGMLHLRRLRQDRAAAAAAELTAGAVPVLLLPRHRARRADTRGAADRLRTGGRRPGRGSPAQPALRRRSRCSSRGGRPAPPAIKWLLRAPFRPRGWPAWRGLSSCQCADGPTTTRTAVRPRPTVRPDGGAYAFPLRWLWPQLPEASRGASRHVAAPLPVLRLPRHNRGRQGARGRAPCPDARRAATPVGWPGRPARGLGSDPGGSVSPRAKAGATSWKASWAYAASRIASAAVARRR